MILTNDELEDLREVALELMINTATIQRYTEVQDGLDITQTYEPISENIPCRFVERDSQGERESTVGGQLMSRGEHIVRFPYGTDVHESDRIIIHANRQERTLEVARVLEHSFATTTSVACTEAR